jgi:hypothetical protein
MTPVDLEGLTLGDIEAIAKRTREAAETLTQALSLLRGSAPMVATAPAYAAPVSTPNPRLSPAELAERERLLRNMRPEMPADIAAAEGMDQ